MRTFLFLLLGSLPCFALKTAYVEFDHPEGWRCELSQGVWICQSTIDADRKESVILSIATVATEWDTLDNYEEYLKQPRKIHDEDGKELTSKVTYVRRRNINGTTWIDSLQQNSELPGFWARYAATVHNKLAILITYIVSNERYGTLAPQFDRMIASLKPNNEFDLNVASKQGDGPLPLSNVLGPKKMPNLTTLLNTGKQKAVAKPEPTPEESQGIPWVALGITVAAGGVIWYVLRRRKAAPVQRKEPTAPAAPPTPKPPKR